MSHVTCPFISTKKWWTKRCLARESLNSKKMDTVYRWLVLFVFSNTSFAPVISEAYVRSSRFDTFPFHGIVTFTLVSFNVLKHCCISRLPPRLMNNTLTSVNRDFQSFFIDNDGIWMQIGDPIRIKRGFCCAYIKYSLMPGANQVVIFF